MLTKTYMSPIKVLSFIFLILAWELLSHFSNPTTFPSLLSIVRTLLAEIFDGDLIFHLGMTLYRVFFSFVIAMILGTGIGMLMKCYKPQ